MSHALLALSVFLAAAVAFAEGTGLQIDETMKKEAMADAASAMITAESALPQTPDGKSAAAQPQSMDDAVKIAMANKQGTNKIESAIKISEESKSDNGARASAGATAANEDSQPVFSNPMNAAKAKAPSSASLWWRMIGSLAIALTLFGGGIYALRKYPGAKKLAGRNKMIEILAQHHLGPKRSLAVVRVAGETCLIGVTDNNINILKTLALIEEEQNIPTAALERDMDDSATESVSTSVVDQVSVRKSAVRTTKTMTGFTKSLASSIYARSKNGSGAKQESEPAVEKQTEEEFTMAGLREIVGERLKTMKEL